MNKRRITTPGLILGLLLLLFAAPDAAAQLTGDTYATARQKGTAQVVFSYIETPGFVGKDAGNKLNGLCIDMMDAFVVWLKKNEGIELKPVYEGKDAKNFKAFMGNVKESQGGVFGLGNITITEERQKAYDFSPPYITNVAILITNKSVATLENRNKIAAAFSGMEAVVVRGTTNEVRMTELKKSQHPNLKFRYVSSSPEALKLVAENENLFTNLDFTYYLQAIKDGLPVKRHPAGDESTESFGIVMPRNSDWGPVMARFMKDFVSGSDYRKVVANNLGPNALKLLDSVSSQQQ
ncbi:transporter substrate-binding domain-containing protein [Cesiribacter sp. SM1]|uniref:transporter substrate-binding domain-containing protein n=1 Tax=Cesiribacter sp. SM1 TaxID=2861196 RepID=UPI001CD19C9C|nr:transporter substrate-binding domain-containing protein [Cesiribacter sp. SM1]